MNRIFLVLIFLLRAFATAANDELRDRRRLEEFIDSMVSEQMEHHRLPGLVVAIVEDGEVRLAKGYGFADLEHRTPVDADETPFPVASVTKVLTAAAVMKVVESGRLRLDEDVNRYLRRFRIEGEPITLAHLLTHTAGFDEYYTGIVAPDEGPITPLMTYLASGMPARIESPGELVAYSNFGIGVAGGIVEEATGTPFARFVEEQIAAPLGMTHSFIGAPSGTPSPLATGYVFRNGSHHPWGTEYLREVLVPAAGLNASGADMARFMIGLLEERPGFLSSSTLQAMYERRFSFHPRIGGATYGLHEHFENGRRALMQDGDWEGFSSRLVLIPEEKVGFFVAYNTSSVAARARMLSNFLDRYYPDKVTARRPENQNSQPLYRFEGTYCWRRFPERDVLKLLKLFARVKVERSRSGALRLSSSGRLPNVVKIPELRFAPAGSLLFERIDGEGRLAFRENAGGEIAYLRVDVPELNSTGSMLFQRTPWYGVPRLQLGIAGVVLPLVLSGIFWPVLYAVRLTRGRPLEPFPDGRRARLLGGLVGSLALLFFLALVPALITITTFGSHLFLGATLSIPLLIAALVPGLCFFALASFRRGFWSLPSRLHYSLFTAATIALLALLHYWNLLGFHY